MVIGINRIFFQSNPKVRWLVLARYSSKPWRTDRFAFSHQTQEGGGLVTTTNRDYDLAETSKGVSYLIGIVRLRG